MGARHQSKLQRKAPAPYGPAETVMESAGRGFTTPHGRRTRRITGDQRERAILETAERLLAERPLKDISIDDLARGAGISRPTFYFYFASKQAVALSLLDLLIAEERAAVDAVRSKVTDNAPQRLHAAITQVARVFCAHRALMPMVNQLLAESPEARALWAEDMTIYSYVEDTVAGIEDERAKGIAIDGPPARDLATALNLMSEGLLLAVARQELAVTEHEVVQLLLTIWSRAIYGNDYLIDCMPPQPPQPPQPPSVLPTVSCSLARRLLAVTMVRSPSHGVSEPVLAKPASRGHHAAPLECPLEGGELGEARHRGLRRRRWFPRPVRGQQRALAGDGDSAGLAHLARDHRGLGGHHRCAGRTRRQGDPLARGNAAVCLKGPAQRWTWAVQPAGSHADRTTM
jgi:TetR/AcrR family transcriptional regulator, ethionamide resistance regulator